MTISIATLGVNLDTSDLRKGEENLKRVQREGNKTADSLEGAGKRGSRGLESIVAAATRVSAAVAALGVSVGLGSALREFASFEQGLRNVGSVAGATAEQMDMLESAALRAAASTRFDPAQTTQALYALASAGQDVASQIQTLPNVLNLAEAAQADLGQTTELLTATLAQYRLGADQSQRVADVFTASIGASALNVDRLQVSFRNAGPTAAALNQSLEGTTAVLGTLTSAFGNGERAGTGLRAILNELPSQAEALGVAIYGADGAMRPFVEILDDIEASGFTGAQAVKEFGAEAGPALAALLSSGSDALRQMEERITANGQAASVAGKQLDTLAGDYAGFLSAATVALVGVGDAQSGYARETLQMVTNLIRLWSGYGDTLGDARESTERLAASIEAVGFAGLAVVVGQVGAAFGAKAAAVGRAALVTAAHTAAIAENARREAEGAAASLAAARASEARALAEVNSTRAVVASVRAEIELEKVRLRAQITDVGRAATIERMAAASTTLASANRLLLSTETALAGATAATAAAQAASAAATVRATTAVAAATVASKALAAAMAVVRGALALVGGWVGALVIGLTSLVLWFTRAKDASDNFNAGTQQATRTVKELIAEAEKLKGGGPLFGEEQTRSIEAQQAEINKLATAMGALEEVRQQALGRGDASGAAQIAADMNLLAGKIKVASDEIRTLNEVLDETAAGGESATDSVSKIVGAIQSEITALSGGQKAWENYQREQAIAKEVAELYTGSVDAEREAVERAVRARVLAKESLERQTEAAKNAANEAARLATAEASRIADLQGQIALNERIIALADDSRTVEEARWVAAFEGADEYTRTLMIQERQIEGLSDAERAIADEREKSARAADQAAEEAIRIQERLRQELIRNAGDFTIKLGIELDDNALEKLGREFEVLDDIERAFDGIGGAGQEAIGKIIDASKAFAAASANDADNSFGAYARAAGFATEAIGAFAKEGSKAAQAAALASQVASTAAAIHAVAQAAAAPFPAGFAAAAAMISLMTSIGAMTGGGGGGFQAGALDTGGASGVRGAGTILGDPEAASESIMRALDRATEIADADLTQSRLMVQSLRNIEAALVGVTSEFARVAGQRGVQSFGLQGTAGSPSVDVSGFSPSSLALLDSFFGSGTFLASERERFDELADRARRGIQLGVGEIFDGMAQVVGEAATAFGADRDAAIAAFQAIDFAGVVFRETDDIDAAIAEFFGALGDSAVEELSGLLRINVDEFQRAGEGLFDTLTRVYAETNVATAGMDRLGQSIASIKPQVTAQLAADLIAAAGGMTEFIGLTQDFVGAFRTESQQLEIARREAEQAIAQMGFVLPGTREEFAALVDSVNVTDQASANLKVGLLALVPALDDLYSLTEEIAADALDVRRAFGLAPSAFEDALADLGLAADGLPNTLSGMRELIQSLSEADQAALRPFIGDLEELITVLDEASGAAGLTASQLSERANLEREYLTLIGDTAALRALERAGISEANRELFDRNQALRDEQAALAAATEAARERDAAIGAAQTALRSAYQAEASELRRVVDQFDRFTGSIRDFRLAISGGFDTASLADNRADFAAVARRAALGDVAALESFVGVGQRFADQSLAQSASRSDYLFDLALIQRAAAEAEAVSGRQRDIALESLDQLTAQVGALVDINESTLSVRDAIEALALVQGPTPSFVQTTVAQPTFAQPAPVVFASAPAANAPPASNVGIERRLERIEQAIERGMFQVAKNTQRSVKIAEGWDRDGLPETRDVA